MKLITELVRNITNNYIVTDEERISKFSPIDPKSREDRIIENVHLISGVTGHHHFIDINKAKTHKARIMEAQAQEILTSAGVLAICTLVGIVRLITLPIRLPIKMLKRFTNGPVVGDALGDTRKDFACVSYDVAYITFGWKVEELAKRGLHPRLSSFYTNLARYVALTLGSSSTP